MTAFNITLPEFNGVFEAGVAVGIDPDLADARKLAIHGRDRGGEGAQVADLVTDSIGLTLRWVWRTFSLKVSLPVAARSQMELR